MIFAIEDFRFRIPLADLKSGDFRVRRLQFQMSSMIIARSLWRKALVTLIAAAGFMAVLEVTMLDSQNLPWLRAAGAESAAIAPALGTRLTFRATAYCKGLVTSAGVAAQSGVAASDPAVLPIGSIIQVDAPEAKYDGVYSVLDTGPAIQGHELDLYMWSCYEALKFGNKPVDVTVLRLGWNPRATTPTFMDRLFNRPDNASTPQPLASRPLPISPPGRRD
jgi:3D (Asp-Asp-Asp) domain-containing protein